MGQNNLPIPELPTSLSLVTIGLVGALCFHSSLNGEFVFDDSEAVVNNADIKLSTPLSNMFYNDFWGTRITLNSSHKSYRPLTVLSYRLNVMAAGGQLWAPQFHLVNLTLYVLLCCLSLPLNTLLSANRTSTAFVASLLFTVHPVHSEAVAPVVGRADLLCALFMFCSFLVYAAGLNEHAKPLIKVVSIFMTVVFAAVSMFTKEQGITVLGLCSAYELLIVLRLHPGKLLLPKTWATLKAPGFLMRQLVLLSAALSLLLLRWWIMGGTVPGFQTVDNPASFMDSSPQRVINYVYVYAINVWLLLCPEWLCFDWSMGCVPLIQSLNDARITVVITFSAVFTVFLVSLLRNTSEQSRYLLMGLAFIVLPFLPASNIFFRVGFVIAERTLLVPSLGVCLFVAHGFHRLANINGFRSLVAVSLLFLVAVFCVRSHVRTGQWLSERALFLSALSVCPLNAKVHYNLAKTSSDQTVAIKHYQDALRLNPVYDQAMNNLANILKDRGQLSEAEALLRSALKLRPDFAAAWMNLGIVLAQRKRFAEAEQCYRTAIRHRRSYPDCFYNLGNLHLELKQYVQAQSSWLQAVTFNPKHHAAWNNLVIMLDSVGKHEEASAIGRQALTELPDSAAIHFNIANGLGKVGEYGQAEEHFKTAIKLRPDYPLYYVNLGVLYHHWKKFGLAKEMYRQALKLDSNLKSAKDNLRLLEDK